MFDKKTVWDVFSLDLEKIGLKELKQKSDWMGISYDYARSASHGKKVFSNELIKKFAERLNYSEESIMRLLTMAEKERSEPEFEPYWEKIQNKIEGLERPSSGIILEKPPEKHTSIPVFSHIRGGNGDNGWHEEQIVDHIDITREQNAAGAFAAQVQGESMMPTLPPGCYAIFRPIEEEEVVRDGTICAVYVSGWSESAVKQIYRDPSGLVILRSINPIFPPITINPENQEFRVIGVLIEARIRF